MKKWMLFLVLLSSLVGVVCGCAKQENSSVRVDTNGTKQMTKDTIGKEAADEATTENNTVAVASGEGEDLRQEAASSAGDYPCMVMLEDKLYMDTGEISKVARCGNMDFIFSSHVKSGEPKKNGETNFDSPIEGQYGARENRIELYYGDEWHVFAFQENDFEGVAMRVTKFDKKEAVLTIYNDTGEAVGYGEEYSLEQYNEESAAWEAVATYENQASEDDSIVKPKYGFHDILYHVEKQSNEVITVNWKDYYGELPKGKYRIVKKFMNLQTDARDYDTHFLMAEFELTGQKDNNKDF